MLRFVSVRVAQFVPTFLVVTVITFALLRLAPGDPFSHQMDAAHATGISAASLEAWRELKGLGEPIATQYVRWLGSMVRFDFGRSFIDEREVSTIIAEALPATLLLSGVALLVVYALSIPLGVFSALRPGSRLDAWLTNAVFALYAMPPFWVALLLVIFVGGGVFELFPIRGLVSEGMEGASLLARALDVGWHLVLPVMCLSYPLLARTSRMQRTAMLEVLSADWVRTARAKGLRQKVVVLRHALRNALGPVVTLLTLDLPWLFGGSVVIERVFTIRGMGMLTFEAILRRDYPVIMGITAGIALVTMASVLAGDVLQATLDPRVRDLSAVRR